MRILHLLSQTELTGAEAYALELIQSQLSAGHDVHVISDKFHLKLPIDLISLPVSIKDRRLRTATAKRVRNILLDKKIEVIHAHSRAAVRTASRARQGLNIGLTSTIHGRQHSSFGKKFRDIYGEYKILVCENLRPQLVDEFHIDQSSLRILRNPFRIQNYDFQGRFDLNYRMGFVGRASGPKGERFKEIFRQKIDPLLRENPRWSFDIVVSQPELLGDQFLELIVTAPYHDRVHIFPPILDPFSFRYLLPNYDLVFGAGRVAVESLLMGVPVYSVGEHCSLGLVNEENLDRCLESNFGDIGRSADSPAADPRTDQGLREGLQLGWRSSIDRVIGRIRSEYDDSLIQREIIEVYRAARFRRLVHRSIPILMYHRIPDRPIQTQHQTYLPKDKFAAHLRFLKALGFSTLTFLDVADFWFGRRDLADFPRRPVILTFDDGYKDNLTNVLPLLREFGFRAVIYLLGNNGLRQNNWDGPGEEAALMSPEERQTLVASGFFEVGSHAFDHLDLTSLSDHDLFAQLSQSKESLSREFDRPILSVAFPFGRTNARVRAMAKKVGYEFAVNTDQGGAHLADDRWSLFRTNIFPHDGLFSIWKKSSPWYRRRFQRKHGR